jgi:poly(A) polymerase
MQAAFKVQPGPWAKNAALNAVMSALGAGRALIVGGAVRSAVLGQTMDDIDIATVLTPPEVTRILEGAGLKVVPTGIDHGTVTAVADHQGFEITTLRRDVETDGRRAVIAFTDDWTEDAQRRDFTMNTLLMNLDGDVFDPTGSGVADLKAGVVRFVGDPDTRIREDGLRILRFFRFHARYGKGVPDQAGFAACAHNAGLIENLSRERVTAELEKLLLAPGAGEAVMAMTRAGILTGLIQPQFDSGIFAQIQKIVLNPGYEINPALLLAYTVCENKSEILDTKIDKFLSLSNRKKDYLKSCMNFLKDHSDSHQKNLILFGQDVTLGGSILLNVFNAKSKISTNLESLVEDIRAIPMPKFPLTANDVMKTLGISQGRDVGDAMKRVMDFWLSKNTTPDRDACLKFLKTLQ